MKTLIRPCTLRTWIYNLASKTGSSHYRVEPGAYQFRRNASTTTLGRVEQQQPFRIAIIGSGPAGFYTATRVIERMEGAMIDMYEALPTPYGLVRYGVAPDHPEVKNCIDRFAGIASSPRFNYIGNVSIGSHLPLEYLKPHYDAFLFSYGTSQDRLLGIPGEDLQGVYSARAFVGWYNELPEYSDLGINLEHDSAVVIGHGNVALDVARILLSKPRLSELRQTDISEQTIAALSKSKIKRIDIVGRRGLMQAAFTIKELRELARLEQVSFRVRGAQEMLRTSAYVKTLPKLEQRKFRLSNLLLEHAAPEVTGIHWPVEFAGAGQQVCNLMSLLSPTSFNTSGSNANALSSLTLTRNEYASEDADPEYRFLPNARVKSGTEELTIETPLAFRSIGYKSTALPTLMSALGVPFDERSGIIPNDGAGRILAPSQGPGKSGASHVPGCYCAGWVKNGPTGVIATTMEDAFASADSLMQDWAQNVPFVNGSVVNRDAETGRGWEAVRRSTHGKVDLGRWVSWSDWMKIDKAERERGKSKGKERDKIGSVEAMLAVLN